MVNNTISHDIYAQLNCINDYCKSTIKYLLSTLLENKSHKNKMTTKVVKTPKV